MLQNKASWTKINIRSIVWSIILLAIGGIISNRSDYFLVWSSDQLIKSITISWWPWFITGIAILSCFSMVWAWLDKKESLSRQQHLSDLDRTLDMLLVSIVSSKQDPDIGMHNFIQQSFNIVVQSSISDVRRGLLLLPDTKREYLTISDHHGWTGNESKEQKNFCIDPQKGNTERGVAGEAFLKKKIIIAHITVENGQIKCDENSYRHSGDTISPFHGSLICVPIIAGEEATDCLGVITFDSYKREAFDPPVIKEVLLALARHIAVALLMRQELLKGSVKVPALEE